MITVSLCLQVDKFNAFPPETQFVMGTVQQFGTWGSGARVMDITRNEVKLACCMCFLHRIYLTRTTGGLAYHQQQREAYDNAPTERINQHELSA